MGDDRQLTQKDPEPADRTVVLAWRPAVGHEEAGAGSAGGRCAGRRGEEPAAGGTPTTVQWPTTRTRTGGAMEGQAAAGRGAPAVAPEAAGGTVGTEGLGRPRTWAATSAAR